MKRLWWCRSGRQEPRPRWRKGIRCCIRAGHVFWQYFTPVLGLITLLAMLTSIGTPSRHLAWRLAATGLMLLVSIATLVYFRPVLIGMLINHGAGLTPEALAAAARRWVALDWVRDIAVAASLAMGIRALLLPLR